MECNISHSMTTRRTYHEINPITRVGLKIAKKREMRGRDTSRLHEKDAQNTKKSTKLCFLAQYRRPLAINEAWYCKPRIWIFI